MWTATLQFGYGRRVVISSYQEKGVFMKKFSKIFGGVLVFLACTMILVGCETSSYLNGTTWSFIDDSDGDTITYSLSFEKDGTGVIKESESDNENYYVKFTWIEDGNNVVIFVGYEVYMVGVLDSKAKTLTFADYDYVFTKK